jgi:hypothetical protein
VRCAVPVPEMSFGEQADGVLSPQVKARLLALLRETLDLIGLECVPGRVEITVCR